MKPVVKFSIKQTVFINVVFVILIVAGAFSMYTIPVENMPTVDMGKVFIYTSYYGASAEDVEQLVTKKIEDALDGLEDVEYIQSRSFRNFSSVVVKFNDDSDYKDLYDELRFYTLNIKDELPEGADEPTFMYLDTHVWIPVIVVNIAGDIPQRSLKLFAKELKAQIMSIPDVRFVNIEGEYEREFHVSIDPARLRKFGVTFIQVADAIRALNTKIPTGRFRTDMTEYMLDAGDRLNSQEEVLNVIVRRDGDGNFIRVRDLVTSARASHRDPGVIPSVNGEDTLRLHITKEESGNSVTITEQIKEVTAAFEKAHLQDDIRIILNQDSTIEINDSINTLGGNLLIGMSLVLLVLWVTIGFRNAMLTAVGIPFAFLCSIIIMRVAGVSLNTIALFAFVLVTGIMVDDAVIIMENVYRHIQMGKPKKDAVIDGTAEVMLPVISSALTTVLAFLPMLIMSGSTGDFFSYVPKTVAYALCASLFEALLILPIHILDWGPKPKIENVVSENEDPFHHLRKGLFAPCWKIYHFLMRTFLAHKFITLTSVFLLFAASVAMLILSATGIMPLIKVQFFPGNYFRYHVTIDLPTGSALEKTDAAVRDLSRFIMDGGPGQAQSASGSAGFYEDEDYQRHNGHNFGQIVVTLPEDRVRDFPENPHNDPMAHLEYIRRKLNEYTASAYKDDEQKPSVKVFEESDGPPTGKDVNIRVTAITMETALKAADAVMTFMKTDAALDALADVEDDRPNYHKTVRYIPKQEAVSEYGLSADLVISMVAGALNGYQAGQYRTIDEEIDLMVRLTRADDKANLRRIGIATPVDILNVPVVEHSASPVLLRDLVEIEYVREASVRSRYKGEPTITITADIKEGAKLSSGGVQKAVSDYFKSRADQFENVALSYGGEFEATSRSFRSLFFAFFIAVLLIYMVLSSQFNDYFQPLIIISAVPFAIIGVVMGLFFTRTVFTVGSFMAVVGLAGVAVNDSLLIIEFINVRRRMGRSLRDAVIEACAARMRPVLITTVTTILGLLPMAIGFPYKSISWAPMATAFVAGLASATTLALLIVPVEYELFEEKKVSMRNIADKIEGWLKRK
ncbi:efflux RND transporter permease subunit [Desulfococcaceae bacterium HSG7]|nr:efflux RND transporter permease subunit [Desulfococcaceae bacterium HSG7]